MGAVIDGVYFLHPLLSVFWVELCLQQVLRSQAPGPQGETSSGCRVFANVISCGAVTWSRAGPDPVGPALLETQREAM